MEPTTLSSTGNLLPPADFDTDIILKKQRQALAGFPNELVRQYLGQLGLSGVSQIPAGEVVLHALILDLYRSLEMLTGPTDSRRSDPLSYYERNVSPVLKLLQQQRALNAGSTPLRVDLGKDFLGYNWHEAEAANGFDAWRWMGPARQAGIMVPAVPGMQVIRLLGMASIANQEQELQARLNGQSMRMLFSQRENNIIQVDLAVPEGFPQSSQLNTFPWYVLELEIQTHRQPNIDGSETRTLGFGLSHVELLGAAND